MKKLLCMILALTTALSLCACGPKADAPEQGEADDNWQKCVPPKFAGEDARPHLHGT